MPCGWPREGDVRDLEGMRAAVDTAVADLGRLDVVVANAGICTPTASDESKFVTAHEIAPDAGVTEM